MLAATEEYMELAGVYNTDLLMEHHTNRLLRTDCNGNLDPLEEYVARELCNGDRMEFMLNNLSVQCVGDIDGVAGTTEILCSYDYAQSCSDEPPFSNFDSAAHKLVLFQVLPDDGLDTLWSVFSPYFDYHRALFDPATPGTFYALRGNGAASYLDEIDGATGEVLGTFQHLPSSSRRQWIEYSDVYGEMVLRPPYLVDFRPDGIDVLQFRSITAVEDNPETLLPVTFTLGQPYPNPFNPTVTVPVQLNKGGRMKVEVFNALGQRVDQMIDGPMRPGEYDLDWDGSEFASGVYFFHVTLDDRTEIKKAVLLK